ncbi:TPX2 (targeting protein for Xklp2) protein family [Arabidopsis thaliana]|uniref:Similarity to unknown protein n=1 Tax=Arabidopsis thaliana TaxID=3702 RepID=Q9FKW1_ARATH|nr:TPX2 (targeting protein for Xklp2) protein family [Arabidopsis thaliana]AED95084.1 TPX2 (targeting protein for Xklp2) protein family [Arabidopsis thaliana]BAB10112.1 unnamed protein product [Arabidopsis thaliana]|eukprot:NP_199240.1 TPX2 (targeting protein for Xklp2) protein family [Arabidopsis thaliana]
METKITFVWEVCQLGLGPISLPGSQKCMRPDYSLALVGKHSKLGTDSVVVLRGEVHSKVLRDCKSRDCTILLVLHNSKSRQVKPSKGKSLMMGANPDREHKGALRLPMTLKRRKNSEFVTSQRVRPKQQSCTEMRKLKTKHALPLCFTKILAAPAMPTPQRSTPHPPEFQVNHTDQTTRFKRSYPKYFLNQISVLDKLKASYRIFQEFNLHVDHRPIERADFDHKIKEKEMMYKRHLEEAEAAKMVEEERALKQLRRTIVPQTRPVSNLNNPFLPHKSNKETTKPNSPKLRVIRRIDRRTMMMVSPHMR